MNCGLCCGGNCSRPMFVCVFVQGRTGVALPITAVRNCVFPCRHLVRVRALMAHWSQMESRVEVCMHAHLVV